MKIREFERNFVALVFQVLHPQSMRPAREGDVRVRVKNSYNPKAPGTLITKTRDVTKVCSLLDFLPSRNLKCGRILRFVSPH